MGAKIKPRFRALTLLLLIVPYFASRGSMYDRVFPLPVSAPMTTSCPSIILGIDFDWIDVAWVKLRPSKLLITVGHCGRSSRKGTRASSKIGLAEDGARKASILIVFEVDINRRWRWCSESAFVAPRSGWRYEKEQRVAIISATKARIYRKCMCLGNPQLLLQSYSHLPIIF